MHAAERTTISSMTAHCIAANHKAHHADCNLTCRSKRLSALRRQSDMTGWSKHARLQQ
jgi:hypothetical protein